jgi:solute carrier family 25 (mitochondrial iron transporter), member 28/37
MTVPFTATQFMAYESLSRVMNPRKEYDPISHCVAGGLAGAFAAGLTTPLDAIKTLLQTRGLSEQADIKKVRGLFNAAAIIKRQYGWGGFFRGLKPRIITTMPSTAICWFVAPPPGNLFTTNSFTDLFKVIIRNGKSLLQATERCSSRCIWS